VDSPVNWSQELVQQLQYAHLIHKVTEQQQEWSKLYDKFQEAAVNTGSVPSKQVRGLRTRGDLGGCRTARHQLARMELSLCPVLAVAFHRTVYAVSAVPRGPSCALVWTDSALLSAVKMGSVPSKQVNSGTFCKGPAYMGVDRVVLFALIKEGCLGSS
jgi:hypothetical protein